MYAKGHSPGTEEFGQYARFGYDADAARDYGMPMRVAKRLGQLWQPWYEDMLQQAGLQGRQSQHQSTKFQIARITFCRLIFCHLPFEHFCCELVVPASRLLLACCDSITRQPM